MGGIGRRYKRKMQGTSSYTKVKPIPPPSNTPSVKQQRTRFKSNGGLDSTLKDTIAIEMDECKQPLQICLRNAIYYHFIDQLDCPYKEHWEEEMEQFRSSA